MLCNCGWWRKRAVNISSTKSASCERSMFSSLTCFTCGRLMRDKEHLKVLMVMHSVGSSAYMVLSFFE